MTVVYNMHLFFGVGLSDMLGQLDLGSESCVAMTVVQ
jgi:hypothetical protein